MAQLTTVLTTSSIYLPEFQTVNNITPVTVSGGVQPYSWTISPALPANLTFNNNNGHVSGQPITLLDPTPYTVTVTDHANSSSYKTFNLSVVVPPLLILVPTEVQIGQGFYSAIFGGPINGSVTLVNLTTNSTPFTFALDSTGSGSVTYTAGPPSGNQTIQITLKNSAGATVNVVDRTVIAYYNLLVTQAAVTNQSLIVNQAATTFTPVTFTGGDGSLTRSISPALPAGLSFNTATGQITGTPTSISVASQYTVTISDTSGQTSNQTFILAVNPLPIVLSQNLGLSVQAFTYNQTITAFTPVTATGGYGTITWTTFPGLPTGLSINSANGQISGTPTAVSTYTTYNIVASDQAGQSTSLPISIAVNPTRLAITAPLSDQTLTVYQPVTLTPLAQGGVGTLSWSLSPALSTGLSFDTNTGQIAGTPTQIRSAVTYTLTVTDQANQSASQTFTITTIPLSALNTIRASNPILVINQPIAATQPIQVYGGYGSKTWSVSPALPAGLVFNNSTGQITGTPTAITASTSYTVTVTDSSSTPQTAQGQFTLSVITPLVAAYTVPGVTSKILNQNESYAFTPVTESGGIAPYSYTISPSLPTGLAFNSASGQIYGTPSTTSTTYPYTITVYDQLNESSSESFILGVGGYGSSSQPVGPVTGLISSKTVASASLYNQLASNITAIMATTSTGYGFTGGFLNPVYSSTSTIAWTDWQKLFYEANLINTHITGSPITLPNGIPVNFTTATVLRADFVDAIIAATNNGVINQYTAAPSQLKVLPITDSSNSVWDSTIISTVKIVSQDTATTQYFFNLGGYIQPVLTLGPDNGLTDPTLLSEWTTLITTANALMASHPYNRSLYLSGSHHYQTPTNVNGDYIALDYTQVGLTEIDITVTLYVDTVGINADSAKAKNFVVTNTVNTYYSHGALNAVTPITKSVVTSFGQGGASITPTVGILTASVSNLTYNMHQYDESPRQTITLTNSGNRPVNILALLFPNNITAQEPVPNVYQGWDQIPNSQIVTTVEPNGGTAYFDVSYVSQKLGIFNNFVLILSDADNNNGSLAVKTVQNIAGPVFRPQLGTTSTYNTTVTSYHILSAPIAIQTTPYVPLASWTTNTSYSVGTPHTYVEWIDPNGGINDLTNNTNIFNIQHLKAGPQVSFNPESFATYYRNKLGIDTLSTLTTIITATISVDCIPRGVPGAPADLSHPTTTSTTIVMNINIPTNQHLGHWLSPTSLDNCIVGMSYDIIGLYPYLTIGVGIESNLITNGQLADPLPSEIADSNYNLNFANLSTGTNADPQWNNGIPLFKVTDPSWISGDAVTGFLYEYGVWFDSDGSSPNGALVNRRYQLNVPADGYYNWQFAADLIGYFAIDGTVLGDTRQADTQNQALTGYTGTVFLTSGPHILQLAGGNFFQPTDANPKPLSAVALNITVPSSNQSIWSTLTPVRSGPTYVGWSEVYRIPLFSVGTGEPQTYYSGNFLVKDTGPVFGSYHWGDFFGDYNQGAHGGGSLFVVEDDGYGNLSIRNQYKTILTGDPSSEQTTDQLQYITWYYDTLDFNSPSGQSFQNHARRIHQLDPGPQGDGSQCHQFIGFSSVGDILTILTRYPGYQNYDPVPRYLIGSFNLATTGKPSGSRLLSLIEKLAANPLLWLLGIGLGLWIGGAVGFLIVAVSIATALFGVKGLAVAGVLAVGIWLAATFSSGFIGAAAGAILDFGVGIIGPLVGASTALAGGVTFLAVLGAAVAVVAVVYLVYAYGGAIWHAVTGVISSVVSAVGNVLSSAWHAVTCCFDPEALVTMADGSYKKIKDVVVGDYVMSQYGQSNRVIGIDIPILGDRQMYKFNDHWAFVSEEHKVLTTNGWQVFDPDSYSVEKASDEVIDKISIGTEIVTQSGTEIVTDISTESRPYYYTIYNLFVDGDSTFIVEGVVVGNRADIIVSAVCEYYNGYPSVCYEVEIMRWLRDSYIIPHRSDLVPLLDAYYYNSPAIVNQINKMDDRHNVYLKIKALLDIAIYYISQGQYQEGVDAFVDMMLYASEVTGITIPEYQEYYQLV